MSKYKIMLTGGMAFEADAENISELLNQLQGREWVVAGDMALHVPQIQAIAKMVDPIGEIGEKE